MKQSFFWIIARQGEYDWLYVSKVFTDTFVPEHILTRETTVYGGTGFFYDKAPVLPEAIEHHTPDYHLYDQMVKEHSEGEKKEERVPILYGVFHWFPHQGCFRKCSFCVNKNSTGAAPASPLKNFMTRPERSYAFWTITFCLCRVGKNLFQCPGNRQAVSIPAGAGSEDYAEKADGTSGIWKIG